MDRRQQNHAEKKHIRRSPRRAYPHPIGVMAAGPILAGTYRVCKGVQISETGLLFTCTKLDPKSSEEFARWVPVNCRVCVSLMIPGGRSIVIRGTVVRHDKSAQRGVGSQVVQGLTTVAVHFDVLGTNEKRLVRNFVSNKAVNEILDAE